MFIIIVEVVEHACGMATLQMGEYVSNVSNGIDTYSLREPLGVCAGICPFNFPAMIPLWVSLTSTYPLTLDHFFSRLLEKMVTSKSAYSLKDVFSVMFVVVAVVVFSHGTPQKKDSEI